MISRGKTNCRLLIAIATRRPVARCSRDEEVYIRNWGVSLPNDPPCESEEYANENQDRGDLKGIDNNYLASLYDPNPDFSMFAKNSKRRKQV